MSSKTKTPVMAAPMPTDRRVVALGRAMGTTTRAAWAMASESWAWLAAEAGDDGVVPGDATLLDAVADVEGLGVAMAAAGLVGVTADGLVLPAELVTASRLLEGGGDVARDDRRRQKAAERARKSRRRKRLSGSTTTSPSTATSGGGQQAVQRRRPRRLGAACGHVVMLLDGQYGAFVQLNGAEPKLTATAESMDYDSVTLADALELLVPIHKSHPAPGGRHRVPKLADLQAAAQRERDRQRPVDAAADTEDGGEQRDGHALVTPVTRDERDGHAQRHAVAEGGSVASPSVGSDLGGVPRHAPRHAHGAPSAANSIGSPSFSSRKTETETETGTMRTEGSGQALERDATAAEPIPAWLVEERARRKQASLEGYAVALGVTVDEILRRMREDFSGLGRSLMAAGALDPRKGWAASMKEKGWAASTNDQAGRPGRGQDVPVRDKQPISVAQAAGIRLPDLSVDRQRGGGDRAAVTEPVQDEQSEQDAQAADDIVVTDEAADEIHGGRDVDVGLDVDDIRESVDDDVDEDVGPDADEGNVAQDDDDDGAHEPADASPESATTHAAS
jgi:hypothetical protein